MNGKGSWPRPRFVSRNDYGNNYDRIFGQGQSKPDSESGQKEGETMNCPCTTVRQLRKMLDDLPTRLDDTPVFVHIAAEDGWATAPIKPQIGRHSEDKIVLLATDLPDELEVYDECDPPVLTVVK
jgi:hypothetical protein